LIVLPISIAIAFGATKVYPRRKKRTPNERYVMLESNSRKLSGALLCLLVLLITFPMAMPTVKAGTRGITSYGSTWYMPTGEMTAVQNTIIAINFYFGLRGYSCYNYYGSLTQKQTVLDRASYMEQSFDHVAMFHHGHAGYGSVGGVTHWDYFDDNGPYYFSDQIWDYEVYPKTWRSKHFFVMLWACRQGDLSGYMDGNGRAVGMPYAWHHPVDWNYDCFIGFKDASMPLTQTSTHNPSVTYYDWILYFIHYALYNHYTIMQALDQASQYCFSLPYYSTELHRRFWATWPYFGSGYGWMKIYGNPGIYLW
jgi:hypothetical protein